MSIPFRADDTVRWTGGELLRGPGDAQLAGASIDSRAVARGELFVAIVGPRHDAHGFLEQAAAAGAGGLLIESGRELPAGIATDLPVIAVNDTTRALGALARGHRAGFDGPLIAITGSNGKTTTKEMCAAILSVAAPCLKNAGNLNNHYGLPITLLQRSTSDRSAVVELGMNHRGEIAELAAIADPSIGVITNVGTAHIEHLGSCEEIAREKGDLVAGLDRSAIAVLNADDPRVAAQAHRTEARLLLYGSGANADVRAENPKRVGGRGWKFDLVAPTGRSCVEVAGLGDTAWQNALAAAAGALAAQVPLEQVAKGLARYEPIAGRLAPLELAGGVTVLDDSYNANPQSMEVALRLLAELSAGGRGIAVLGDMGELGGTARDAHRDTGRRAAELGIDFVFALGERASDIAEGARSGGMPAENVRIGGDWEDLAADLGALLEPGDRVLVKGSRAMRMERIAQRLATSGRPPKERS